MPFPNTVNYTWAAGFPGRWSSENPRRLAVPGPNGFRTAAAGLTIARFAWVQADGTTVLNRPVTDDNIIPPTGFVVACQQGLVTQYLEEHTMLIPGGFMVNLATGGDVFAQSNTYATVGQAVYASTTDGTIQTGNSTPPAGTVATGWKVSQGNAAGSPIIITGPVTAA